MTSARFRVAVAEDEPLNQRRLVRLLEEAGCEVVAAFGEGASLLEWLAQGPPLDALFLDIHMPGPSGLEVASRIGPGLPVVFVTAHGEHAVEAFEEAAVDYLLKPATAARIAKCLDRLRSRKARDHAAPATRGTRYPVKAGGGLVFLELARTTHFEVVDEVVFAFAASPGANAQRFETTWKSLGEVEQVFAGAGLLRLHRHLLVRPEAVLGLRAITNGRMLVTLPGGVELESSRGATPGLRARLGLG